MAASTNNKKTVSLEGSHNGANTKLEQGSEKCTSLASSVNEKLNVDVSITKEDTDHPAEHGPPEGGWGWVVCIASFWTNGTIFGILNSFGVIYVKLLEELKEKEEQSATAFKTSLVGSVCVGLTFLMSPLSGILIDLVGIRKTAFCGGLLAFTGMLLSSFFIKLRVLYVTYGLMMGIGCSLAYTPSLVILGHYFKRRLGLVNGLVTAGSAVFTIVYPLLLKPALEKAGLSLSFKILSGFLGVMCLSSLVFRPRLHHPQHTVQEYVASITSIVDLRKRRGIKSCIGGVLNYRIWKNWNYVFWVIGVHVAFYGYFVPFAHLPNHVNDVLPGYNGGVLIMCLGGGHRWFGRIVFGKIADMPRINRVRLQQLSILVIGIMSILMSPTLGTKSFWVLVVIVLIMGIFDGCCVCMFGPIAFSESGARDKRQYSGLIDSIPMTAGPPIAGLVYDALGNYRVAFFISGVPAVLGALLFWLVRPVEQHFPAVTEAEELHAGEIEALKEDDVQLPAYEKEWLVQLESRSTTPLPLRRPQLSEHISALTNSFSSLTGSFRNINRQPAWPVQRFGAVSTEESLDDSH
ncbi:PREDICTED: monocarboxylate transporter 10-like [Priapulus caudatus]|uniref:Monocarboxylate transporter 10-like n=1 Tax=Priapulus caudatus TaxID=37621 RepID=A0ABM1E7Q1_PRICU|nr:PREDICTED: monocarboxylate transporter 10-like [Priapulus caudatus]